jgi:hypothetical protein
MHPTIFRFLPAAALCLQTAVAMEINLTYATTGQAGSIPAGDANGTQLMAIAQAAANYWEDIIEDTHTLNVTIRYDNGITAGLIGQWAIGAQSNGRPDSGTIGIRGTTAWYYDPTPTNHSEYNMTQTLFRNAAPADVGNFTGTVPGTLEINFMGLATPEAPVLAQNGTDLYTTLLHELGHAVGMSTQLTACALEVQDNDFDINPALANGNAFAIVLGGNTGAHAACTQCLMNPGIGTGRRRLPSAADVLAVATSPNPGWSQIDLPRRDFLQGGTQTWNTAANWIGNRVPGASDDAAVRHGLDIPGDPLVALSGDGACRTLLVTNTTRLRTQANKLDVALAATLDYDGTLPAPEIFVENGGELEATDVVVNGGELDLTGGLLDISDDLILSDEVSGRQGILTGYGTLEVDGTLRNDGRIDAGDGQTLVFNSPSLAPWDLDGASGNGEVLALLGSLNFATGAMSDAFDGLLQIEAPHTVTFGEAWSLGAGGLVRVNGGDPALATLAGALFEASTGDIQVTGRSRISAPVMFGGSLEFIAGADAHLLMDGLATITGGAYLLGANSVLEFNNNTSITGGAFLIPAGATVRLDGTHTLEGGSFSGLGTLAFNGMQTTIDQAVTISCNVLDFDGPGGAKQVQVNAPLTIHSDQLDLSDSKYDSTLNIGPSPAALHVNGPAAWTMAGTLNVNTDGNAYLTSLIGAPLTVSGTVHVTGSTRWDARATLSGGITLGVGTDRLELRGGSENEPNRLLGGTVSGSGVLRAVNAHLRGFGAVLSSVDFQPGTSLLADDGQLTLGGALLSVPPLIGTADSDGVLQVVNDWTLPAGKLLSMNGGIVRGGDVTLTGHLVGHGALQSNDLTNNGAIVAEHGQTLTIDTTSAPDLDGTGTLAEVAAHLVEAVQGNLLVVKTPGDVFGATLTIGPGRSATFQNGWTLDAPGTLNMTSATLAGGPGMLQGAVVVNDFARITAPSHFDTGSSTALDEMGDTLHFQNDATIGSGAVFSGNGRILVSDNSTLTLAPGAAVDVQLENKARVAIASGAGSATTKSFTQSTDGTLVVEILGTPVSMNFDQFTVSGTAALDGRLEVLFNAPDAQPGDTWNILTAGAITGAFLQLTAAGVPAGHELLLLQTADGVYLKLAQLLKFGDWAQAAGLTPPDDDVDGDPDKDGLGNGLEMFLGGNPLKPEPALLPEGELVEIDGKSYLAITLPAGLDTLPADLKITALRSTDLMDWKHEDTVVEVVGQDHEHCIEYRRYRSAIPFDSLPREYLTLRVIQQ